MAYVTLKKEFNDTFIAYGGGGKKKLGERKDLHKLALMAVQSKSKSLLNMFEKLPSEKELIKMQTDLELSAVPKQEELKKPVDVAVTNDTISGTTRQVKKTGNKKQAGKKK